MRRDGWIVAIFWVALAVVGEIWARNADIYPAVAAAQEARHVDEAFRRLLVLGIPVFTFVIVVLGYSVLRYRADAETVEDGPAIHGNRLFSVSWLLITGILAATLFYNPGLTGWSFLHANPVADMVVQVEAVQWHWHVTYPQQGLGFKSSPAGWEMMEDNTVLVLPAHRRVKFEITSADVIHSFWIPAFRMKIDAVPGKTTTMFVTPDRPGTFDEDVNYRIQCAEMCGTGHPRMNMRLAVMEPEAFDKWVAQQQGREMDAMDTSGMDMGAEEEHQHEAGE